MKQLVWVIVQSVCTSDGERKSIHGVYVFEHQAHERMNEIVVEFEDKQAEQELENYYKSL